MSQEKEKAKAKGDKKRVRGTNGKAKGAEFELQTAHAFSSWWGEKFRRTPLSGGWGEEIARGDITPVERFTTFPFCVECKRDESFDLWHLFEDPPTGPFPSFWGQVRNDAENEKYKQKLIPLLVFKINFKPVMVASREPIIRDLLGIDKSHFVVEFGFPELFDGDEKLLITKFDYLLESNVTYIKHKLQKFEKTGIYF